MAVCGPATFGCNSQEPDVHGEILTDDRKRPFLRSSAQISGPRAKPAPETTKIATIAPLRPDNADGPARSVLEKTGCWLAPL